MTESLIGLVTGAFLLRYWPKSWPVSSSIVKNGGSLLENSSYTLIRFG